MYFLFRWLHRLIEIKFTEHLKSIILPVLHGQDIGFRTWVFAHTNMGLEEAICMGNQNGPFIKKELVIALLNMRFKLIYLQSTEVSLSLYYKQFLGRHFGVYFFVGDTLSILGSPFWFIFFL